LPLHSTQAFLCHAQWILPGRAGYGFFSLTGRLALAAAPNWSSASRLLPFFAEFFGFLAVGFAFLQLLLLLDSLVGWRL
jgi:hypothetical protein